MRWTWRVVYYPHAALGTDRSPPFTLGPAPEETATLDIAYPEHLSRGLVLVKWWLLAIPQYLIVAIFQGGWGLGHGWGVGGWWWGGGWWGWDGEGWVGWFGGGVVGILVLIAAVVLLVGGSYPKSLHEVVVGLNRWTYRVVAYAGLMRDEYPPFRLSP